MKNDQSSQSIPNPIVHPDKSKKRKMQTEAEGCEEIEEPEASRRDEAVGVASVRMERYIRETYRENSKHRDRFIKHGVRPGDCTVLES